MHTNTSLKNFVFCFFLVICIKFFFSFSIHPFHLFIYICISTNHISPCQHIFITQYHSFRPVYRGYWNRFSQFLCFFCFLFYFFVFLFSFKLLLLFSHPLQLSPPPLIRLSLHTPSSSFSFSLFLLSQIV